MAPPAWPSGAAPVLSKRLSTGYARVYAGAVLFGAVLLLLLLVSRVF